MTSGRLTYAGFAVIAAAALVWQLVAILGPRRATIGQLQRWMLGSRAYRVAIIVFWAWLGVHIFARGRG